MEDKEQPVPEQPAGVGVNPHKVISILGRQLGEAQVQIAMLTAALEAKDAGGS